MLAWKVGESSLSPHTLSSFSTPLLPSPHTPHTPNPTLYSATTTCSSAFREKEAVYSSLTTPTTYSAQVKLDLTMHQASMEP